MATIKISDDIRLIVSEKTAEAINECRRFEEGCKAKISDLRRMWKSAYEERDYNDCDWYDEQICDLQCKISEHWDNKLGYEL